MVTCRQQQCMTASTSATCDRLAKVNEINLGDTTYPKQVFIAIDLQPKDEATLVSLLLQFKDMFTLSYTDMHGVPKEVISHTLPMQTDACPICQLLRRMKTHYAQQVKAKIDKMLVAGMIYPIWQTTWVSPIVVVPKKNGKIRVCINYR